MLVLQITSANSVCVRVCVCACVRVCVLAEKVPHFCCIKHQHVDRFFIAYCRIVHFNTFRLYRVSN
jgi:hypothetical protein